LLEFLILRIQIQHAVLIGDLLTLRESSEYVRVLHH
jgi:hypothetical protein